MGNSHWAHIHSDAHVMNYNQLSLPRLKQIKQLWTEEYCCAKLDHDYKAMLDIQERIDAVQKEIDYRREG